MATKKSNGEKVGGGGNKPDPLPEAEWAFHRVPKDKIRYCAMWELGRLWGSKQKPWLTLTLKERERFVLQEQGSSLQEIPASSGPGAEDFARRVAQSVGEKDSSLKKVTFLVNFREREGILRELFRLWLKYSPQRQKWRKGAKPPRDRWRSLLAKIVILRATEAGLTRESAIRKTAELWKKWKWGQKEAKTGGILSAPHWSRAKRQAMALRERAPVICDPPYNSVSDAKVLQELFRVMLGGGPVKSLDLLRAILGRQAPEFPPSP